MMGSINAWTTGTSPMPRSVQMASNVPTSGSPNLLSLCFSFLCLTAPVNASPWWVHRMAPKRLLIVKPYLSRYGWNSISYWTKSCEQSKGGVQDWDGLFTEITGAESSDIFWMTLRLVASGLQKDSRVRIFNRRLRRLKLPQCVNNAKGSGCWDWSWFVCKITKCQIFLIASCCN